MDRPTVAERGARRWCAALASAALALLAGCDAASEQKLLEKAKSALAKGDVAAAQIHLKNALDRNPESGRTRLLLGQTMLRSGDAAAALIELRKARAAGLPEDQVVPDLARAMAATGETPVALLGHFSSVSLATPEADADLKATIGAAHAATGDRAAARRATEQALQRRPGFMPAVVLLAHIDLADGNSAAALQGLDEALVKTPGHERASILKADILARLHSRLDEALKVLRDAITANPQSIPARVTIVRLLQLHGQAAEARTELEALSALAPQHPETLMLQARQAFDAKDYKTARMIAEQVLTHLPRQGQMLVLAGTAEYQMKQYAQADALLARALKENPGNLVVRQLMARTFLRLDFPERALEVLRPAEDSPQADSTSLSLLGEAHLAAGDGRRAEAAFQRAVKIAPTDASARTSLAAAQFARGEADLALPELEALARDERSTRADLALISARLWQKDMKGALAAAEALMRKAPDQAYPLVLHGRLLARQGDTAAATASFEAALAKEPASLPAVAGLAEIDLRADRPAQARQRFEALIKADPRNVPARIALNTLDARLGAPPTALAVQLREAVRIDPRQPLPHLLLIETLLSAGDPQAALLAAQAASAALPDDPVIVEALARALIVAGDGAQAVSTIRRLVSMQPKRAKHYVLLADAHLVRPDRASAAAELRRALEIQPGLLPAERGLALLSLADRKPHDALAMARTIQKRSPKDPAGFALEGEIEAAQRNWSAAAAAYAAALQRVTSTDLAVRYHQSLVAGGKVTEAERTVADWLKRHPRDGGFLLHLGDMAVARMDLVQAEARYRAVLALQPRHAVAMNNVAWLLASQGKPGGAEMAEAALKLLPERAPLLDTLSLALEVEKQLGKAIEVQKRATELEPLNPHLRLRLAKLLIKNGDRSAARKELQTLAGLGKDFAGQDEVASLLKTL